MARYAMKRPWFARFLRKGGTKEVRRRWKKEGGGKKASATPNDKENRARGGCPASKWGSEKIGETD